MKHIKTYESNKIKFIEGGDYVIIDPYTYPEEVSDWIMSHIGQIIDIKHYIEDNGPTYIVKYEDIPEGWDGHFTYGDDEYAKNIRKTQHFGIEHFSRSKKKLELILKANKYNL